jgi:predicted LPLAT superfamily acyltransferase
MGTHFTVSMDKERYSALSQQISLTGAHIGVYQVEGVRALANGFELDVIAAIESEADPVRFNRVLDQMVLTRLYKKVGA